MRLSLGIDTGGTYTDAVLFDDRAGVVATAKSLTTRHELSIGIAAAVDAVLARASAAAADIALVSLSTTLATNALVEGRGGRVALVFIGFGDGDELRDGLPEAMDGDPIIRISGGHDPHGSPLAELDIATLEREARAIAATVTGFAVSAQFATRNTSHELAAQEVLVRATGLPVTCGHELSAKLNGPRRAVTSVLNARLIGLIAALIDAARQIMRDHAIDAPLMVVRGDGALMAASMAMTRPIETILSGPAASLVGASYLTGLDDAMVADIGGTTTDVAVIAGGLPRLDSEGARVGGFRTMVEAVAMTTIGLGGDSEVTVDLRAATPTLALGPRRVVPISMIAADHPEAIHLALDRQLLAESPSEHDGRFILNVAQGGASRAGLHSDELALLDRLSAAGAVVPVATAVRRSSDVRRLDRLVGRGVVMIAGFTPTDASHVLGDFVRFDADAARKAATLHARTRSMSGRAIADDGHAFAEWVITTLRRRSAETLLDVGLAVDGFGGVHLSHHPFVAASLDGRSGVVDLSARISLPVVGLGAAAPLHYPAVAALLRARAVVPEHADVANAIGAVVGHVRVHADVYVSQPERGRFRVHRGGEDDVFALDAALSRASEIATTEALALADAAGADHADAVVSHSLNIAEVEGEELFVEATVTATASGRPRLATAGGTHRTAPP